MKVLSMKTFGYAAQTPTSRLEPFPFERRALRGNDVLMEVLYCGICHSDLHQARNDWGFSEYPIVPGHEIVGRVAAVGPEVKRHKVGDAVAVGCMVDSCMACDQCRKGEEQLCRDGNTQTYNGKDRFTCEPTYGGYSKHLVVREEFALSVPEGLDLARTAPLLCAGITTWSPLRTWNVGPESKVGVIGLGGLGHMAVKLAAGLGADVTVMSRTKNKEADALALGADRMLVSSDAAAMTTARSRFRPDHRHGSGRARHRSLSAPPRRRRHACARRADRAAAQIVHGPVAVGASPGGRLADRRHQGDARDARFLRQEEHPA